MKGRTDMKTLYLESVAGASGDMLLGALCACGLDWDRFRAPLEEGVPGLKILREAVQRGGLEAWRLWMESDEAPVHRHLSDVLAIVERLHLPEAVKDAAARDFRRLAEVESAAHGEPVDHVHFHEVGALDSILDVVGFHWALHLLEIDRVVASPLKLGWGSVETAHGTMPVPAPATAHLVEGLPVEAGPCEGELTTPTGALLIGGAAEAWGAMPAMRVETSGLGAGSRLQPRFNVLRAWVGEEEGEKSQGDGSRPASIGCLVLETHLDDVTPEALGLLREGLEERGAFDVAVFTGVGKKGRPVHAVTVVAPDGDPRPYLDMLFRHSTALGVRLRRQERVCLDRRFEEVEIDGRTVAVKLGYWEGDLVHLEAEFEDCAAVVRATGRPLAEVQHEARERILSIGRDEEEDAG